MFEKQEQTIQQAPLSAQARRPGEPNCCHKLQIVWRHVLKQELPQINDKAYVQPSNLLLLCGSGAFLLIDCNLCITFSEKLQCLFHRLHSFLFHPARATSFLRPPLQKYIIAKNGICKNSSEQRPQAKTGRTVLQRPTSLSSPFLSKIILNRFSPHEKTPPVALPAAVIPMKMPLVVTCSSLTWPLSRNMFHEASSGTCLVSLHFQLVEDASPTSKS